MFKELNRIVEVDEKRAKIARAPGRANIIGEHTDYNEGYVLPCTVDRDIVIVAQPCNYEVILHSINLNTTIKFPLRNIRFDPQDRWGTYPKGVAHYLLQAGYEIDGLIGVIHGTIPARAGLGSSAALEIATALIFQLLYDIEISPVEMALLCFKAENEFGGVSCGIMDQFASALGRRDSLLFLDCRTLSHEAVEIPSSKLRVVLLNTMVERSAEAVLNKRKLECQKAVQIIKKFRPETKSLRDLSTDDFEQLKNKLPATLGKRCQHVVYENERVIEMVKALKRDRFDTIGELMHTSHASCRDLYEVSCRELDTMVEIAETIDGVVGCRMTGAGLGGCAVCLVWDRAVEELAKRASESYKEKTGINPEIYVSKIPPGAGEFVDWNENSGEIF